MKALYEGKDVFNVATNKVWEQHPLSKSSVHFRLLVTVPMVSLIVDQAKV